MQDFGANEQSALFAKCFSNLKEVRRTTRGNFLHLLSNIVFMTISAVLCGANGWDAVGVFSEDQEEWLKAHGDFKNGIPSHYTEKRVFPLLSPKSFGECFTVWVSALCSGQEKGVIAIDGKCIRGADPKTEGKKLAHIVSAFSSANGLCFALPRSKLTGRAMR